MIFEAITSTLNGIKSMAKRALVPDIDDAIRKKVSNTSYQDKKINFVKASKPDRENDDASSSILLKHSFKDKVSEKNNDLGGGPKKSNKNDFEAEGEQLKKSDSTLFPTSWLANRNNVYWPKAEPIGPGLQNLGNTCFLNSVLQCLSYSPPLVIYLRSGKHSSGCKKKNGFCIMCEMEKHARECLHKPKGIICPKGFASNLKNIAKHMKFGAQEDAHEFLRYVIDGLQRACLMGTDPKVDARLKETTIVHQIFGGYLQSQVKCLKCKYLSNTFDPMLDLSLDIRNVDTVERALKFFTKTDMLVKSNQYKCEKCKTVVDAAKAFSIYEAPLVLTVQLKRFRLNGSKISKKIHFNEHLDMTPFMSRKNESVRYRLYGIIVHSGTTCYYGHYYAYVKSAAGIWYCMNDSAVTQVSVATVLKQDPYILMYLREPVNKDDFSHSSSAAAAIVPNAIQQKCQINNDTFNGGEKSSITDKSSLTLEDERKSFSKPKLEVAEQSVPQSMVSEWDIEDLSPSKPVKWERSKMDFRLDSTWRVESMSNSNFESEEKGSSSSSSFEVGDRESRREEKIDRNMGNAEKFESDSVVVNWQDSQSDKIDKLQKVMKKECNRNVKKRYDPSIKPKDLIYGSNNVTGWDDESELVRNSRSIKEKNELNTKRLSSYDLEYDQGRKKKRRVTFEENFQRKKQASRSFQRQAHHN